MKYLYVMLLFIIFIDLIMVLCHFILLSITTISYFIFWYSGLFYLLNLFEIELHTYDGFDIDFDDCMTTLGFGRFVFIINYLDTLW